MTARLRLLLGEESGLTLVELVVSVSLLFAIGIAWSALMTATAKTGGRVQELAGLQSEVRSAVDLLAADLRQAVCNDTTPPVTTASATQLTFYSPDRASPYHLRQISYRLVSDSLWPGRYQLERAFATSTNTNGPPWTIPALGAFSKKLGSIINSTAFAYRDANGNTTTTPSAVGGVSVTLQVAPHAGLGGASATYQTTSIDLRAPSCS